MNVATGSGMIRQNPDAVLINDANLHSGVLVKHRLLLKNVKCWHKFVVNNTAKLSRDEVLKPVLDQVHPLDLIPVFFTVEGPQSCSFLARNCEAAIEKLCADHLVVTAPNLASPFKLSIILNYASTNDVRIDVQKNVLRVLQKRFDALTRVLNLDNFHRDPDLDEFCPLSQPKIMYFVLHIAKGLQPEVLILSNNFIKLLNPLDVLIGLKLRKIDLSYNELAQLDALGSLKHFSLKELHLTGNFLCCDCSEDVYVSRVRSLCPTVEVLDGVTVVADKLLTAKKSFFADFGVVDVLDAFLEHFFTVYDSEDRSDLSGLYRGDAMFSLTCVYLAGQLSSATASLKAYSNLSRNILKSADLSKSQECLFWGREKIVDVFVRELPATAHDPSSFTVDLTYRTEKCIVFTLTGVYKERPVNLLDRERFLGFTRTFALQPLDQNRYVITNDQLHVYNGLTYQEKTSFLRDQPQTNAVNPPLIPKPANEEDYADLISTLAHLTGLKDEWAKKCLEECSYDLKAALELFVDLYKGEKMPLNAFN